MDAGSTDSARSPFEPDRLDELLSAELDGELDAAAHDLGLTLDEVSARVRATPGAGARRTALAAARELLGRPDEIGELTASRLRAAAVGARAEAVTPTAPTDPTRHRKVLVGLGVAAASVAALGALAVLASGLGDTSTAKSSGAAQPVEGAAGTAGTVEKRPATVPTAALGEFTDQGALARAAVAHDATKRSESGAATNSGQSSQGFAPAAADVPTATPAPLKQTEKSAADTLHPPETRVPTNGSDSTRAATCSTPPGVPAGAAEVLRATATLSGNPVIVLVFAGRDEHVVVTEDIHCMVKNLQMLR